MTGLDLRILQVSTFDVSGGAERIAWNLARSYRERGHQSLLAVGHKLGDDPEVLVVPNDEQRGRWSHFWLSAQAHVRPLEGRVRGPALLGALAGMVGEPGRAFDHYRGIEGFRFPGTWRLLTLTDQPPHIVHCHNLHGHYFDLRALPWLSQEASVVLTLHDAWLLSGHCAHSFDCERWKTGCGHCPDLTIDPAVRRDATAYNWRRKSEIFKSSHLHVATPSRWLMQKVEQSMLADGVVDARVIPNGVDLSIFRPTGREEARENLRIRKDARVVLIAANAIRTNIWKDYQSARSAFALAAERLHGQEVILLVLGEDAPAERVGAAEIRFVPYQTDLAAVARYYQAADVYLHTARADTFPNTVLEALACGTPVVATNVGGIPEQIADAQTGFLVRPSDARALGDRLTQLLSDTELRERMGVEAVNTARRTFDFRRQADTYLEWYHELVHRQSPERVRRSS
jgi:glycosyltransferase involved in cell wall biosynthesis